MLKCENPVSLRESGVGEYVDVIIISLSHFELNKKRILIIIFKNKLTVSS